MNAITIKQIQTFLAILQAGSFRAGSETLHLSQPAVTAHIKQLELALGMPLLDRTTRRLRVTVAGERFRIRAEQALAELNSAVLELRDEAALKRGRISIACVPTIAAGLLPKALGRFAEKFPGITVKVYDVVAQQVLLQVAQAQADIGIGPRPLGRSEFDFHAVTRDPYVAVIPRRHPWATKKSVPLVALTDTDFLALLPGSHVRETLDAAMESQSLKLVPRFEVQHHYTLGGMVEAGLGVTALPSMAVSMLSQPLLRAVPIIRKPVVREVGIVKVRGKKLSPAAAVLINEFKDVVAENSSTKL
jgi:LysR family transcriptional regulator, carnitine catabolism transcriptional activator